MAKIKVITILLFIVLVLSIGIGTYAQENDLEISNNKFKSEAELKNEEIIREEFSEAGKPYPEGMNEKEYEKVYGEIIKDTIYNRKKVLFEKGLPADTRRITLDEVLDIIENSDNVEEIKAKIDEVHVTYDTDSGSGLTILEYWFDEQGSSGIIIYLELREIFVYYGKDNFNKEILYYLYSERHPERVNYPYFAESQE